ncbi:MAG: ABC transporter permease, partial [Chloroflexota bacterium]
MKAGLRDLLRRPLQTGLVVFSLALGVAVVIAIDLANQSAQQGFEFSAQSVVGRATHRIVGGPAGLAEALYRQLRVENGLRQSAPIVEGIAAIPGLDQRPVRVLGVDLFAEAPFRGHLEGTSAFIPEFAPFFTTPGTAVVTEEFSTSHGLAPGDTLEVQTNDRLATITVLGVLSGEPALGSADLLLMDIASAQELLGMVGRLSRIDLILDEASAARLAADLPPGARLETASEQVETANQLTAAFRTNLTALSLLALVVGMFLIYNTMTFAVVRRRPVLGTMLAVGATGGQVF